MQGWIASFSFLALLGLLQTCTGSEEAHPTIDLPDVTAEASVEGMGFHRLYVLSGKLPISILPEYQCRIQISLTYPKELFFNPDLLSLWFNEEKFLVYSKESINTELHANEAEEGKIDFFSVISDEKYEEKVPVHFRYQPPCNWGDTRLRTGPTAHALLLNCSKKALGGDRVISEKCWAGSSKKCRWLPFTLSLEDRSKEYKALPCGKKWHLVPVVISTIALTSALTVYFTHFIVTSSIKQ